VCSVDAQDSGADSLDLAMPLMEHELNDHIFATKRGNSGKKTSFRSTVLWLARIFVIALAVWGAISIWSPQRLPSAAPRPFVAAANHTITDPQPSLATKYESDCNCGTSTTEAKALGCHFVQLSAAWLPPECIDEELSDEFDQAGPGLGGSWTYWSDAERQHEVNKEQLALFANTGQLFYSTWEWHVKHCTYQWRLLYRKQWLHTVLEPRYNQEFHVMHCEGIMFADRNGSTGGRVGLNSTSKPDEHLHSGQHGHEHQNK